MVNRRRFMKTAALAAGGTAALNPIAVLGSRYQTSSGFFGVHAFIENNPDAVFIMKTNVDVKTNSQVIKQTSLDFCRSVIVPKESGVPLTHLIPVKPNATDSFTELKEFSLEYGMGVITDPYFVEGMIEGMKELGLSGNQFHLRQVTCSKDFQKRGYTDMALRTGADLQAFEQQVGVIGEDQLQWVDLPEGVWFRKIPYLWPINAKDTWLLNISKFKAHGMGLTLCAKNLQGSICLNYQAHCSAPSENMDMKPAHRNPNCFTDIKANYDRHNADGIPRWDKPGTSFDCGLGMETWVSRCLDNNNATKAGLHVIEGIYGRDGNGFQYGPHPAGNEDNYLGKAQDYMTNIIIFGKNQFHVDVVGHWLGGHEPGNFGLYHIAKERGMSKTFNPMNIPVYDWKADGSAKFTPLTEYTRTPLMTYYLQRNYNGQTEKRYHLCDEPFEYKSEPPLGVEEKAKPNAFVLDQNRPNPFNPSTSIEYTLPRSGNARLEIFNSTGQLMEVLVDGHQAAGSHMTIWNTTGRATGTYFYRFRFGGLTETKKMLLLK